ncbi:unnamed protein product [Sphenostylis stenocarpa]|uniref:Uncharacterized protein n=1 Tax=Sphenostylis stenocarpa TaxID=92480 RepID=A0AA86W1H1_9FABA|nr:unnamed protein product [Sphenostylis stenocarpa]
MSSNVEEEPPKQSPPNLLSLFPKIQFQFPFLPHLSPPQSQSQPRQSNPQDEGPNLKRNVVRFPKTQAAVVSSTPLQTELDADHSPAVKTTNPLLLWQLVVKLMMEIPSVVPQTSNWILPEA